MRFFTERDFAMLFFARRSGELVPTFGMVVSSSFRDATLLVSQNRFAALRAAIFPAGGSLK
jgi:hypothetical protein